MNLPVVEQRTPAVSPAEQMRLLGALPLASTFEEAIASTPLQTLRAREVTTLQINVGKKCNQTCAHCHVDAGPDRTEMMSDAVVDDVIALLKSQSFRCFDITGGAPELHPRFEEMVRAARTANPDMQIIDRCNLTILMTRKYAELHKFLAEQKVDVVASLPYHSKDFTDRQRGDGVFDLSIDALKKLNAVGYGVPGSSLVLTLVTNPVGAFLPADQASLEATFRRNLRAQFGVEFTNLFCIANLPISRYLQWLDDSGNLKPYMDKLVSSFNSDAANGVMCRDMVSVGWDGNLYDCDFNQMLELPLTGHSPRHISEFAADALVGRTIAVGPHCFGCTAGQGSSCGGAVE